MRAAVTHVSTSINNRLVYCCRKWINGGKGRKIDKNGKKNIQNFITAICGLGSISVRVGCWCTLDWSQRNWMFSQTRQLRMNWNSIWETKMCSKKNERKKKIHNKLLQTFAFDFKSRRLHTNRESSHSRLTTTKNDIERFMGAIAMNIV